MSNGATYLALLTALKQDDTADEARRRQRSTDVIRRRRGRSLGATLLQVLRVRR